MTGKESTFGENVTLIDVYTRVSVPGHGCIAGLKRRQLYFVINITQHHLYMQMLTEIFS